MEENFQFVSPHKRLAVWNKALELVLTIYTLTAKFPHSEKFGLASQMQRAAVSIPSNIAEGRSRKSTNDYVHFLHIALGSAAELETQLEITFKLQYLDATEFQNALQSLLEVRKMLAGMLVALKKRS
jgi:four helix bundle protein